MYYHHLAKLYRWTPSQVDDESSLLLDRMIMVARVEQEIANERQSSAGN